jgi:hypothetical protein
MSRSSAPFPTSSRTASAAALLLYTGLVSPSCGDSDYAILVRVQGAPSDTRSLNVSATLDGKPAPGMDVTTKLDYFGIRLPRSAGGTLEVSVSALGEDQCKSASGKISISLSAGRSQETSVTLSSLSPRLCSLYFQSSGDGELTINPQGTSCGTGCMDYPAGTMVAAGFTPAGRSFGAQLSFNGEAVCDGFNPCSFTLNRRAQLTARFNPRLCLSSKWCWYNPLPQGSPIASFGGSGPSDIWAVGFGGTILHHDGQIWSVSASGTTADLYGVWSSSPTEAWAVGDRGVILRWDGSRWSPQTSGVVSNLQSVWGSASNDVWAVGQGGVALRYNGTTWSSVPTGAAQSLYRVSGSSSTNVWAVGPSGTVIRFDGSVWTQMPVTGQSATNWSDAWVSATGEVWTVGLASLGMCVNARYDGTGWTSQTGCSGSASIWGSSTADVWTAGSTLSSVERTPTPDLRTFDKQVLYLPAMYPGAAVPTLNTIWGFSPGEAYIGTLEGNILKRNAETKTTILTAPPSIGSPFFALAGNGNADNLFVVRQDGVVYRWDGRRLSLLTASLGPTTAYDAWAAPGGDLFVASTNGSVYRYSTTSNTWSNRSTMGAPLFAMGGVSASEMYVGTSVSAGILYRFDGTGFNRINGSLFNYSVQAIWMRGSGDGWAVGDNGMTIRISSTNNASTVANGSAGSNNLYGVAGVPSSTHVWAVGTNGYVGRYDGASWSRIMSGTTVDLSGVAALAENDVWFAGNGGTLLHWDGTSITAVPSGTTADLHKIWGTPTTGLWLAGDAGVLMRYQPQL